MADAAPSACAREVLLVTAAGMAGHQGGFGESPARLQAAWQGSQRAAERGVALARAEAQPAADGDLERAHTARYVKSFMDAVARNDPWFMHPDCPLSPLSEAAARLAAGAAALAARRVAPAGPLRAFCAVRPPGHHAWPERASGFCYYNNAVIAAKILAERFGAVHILDVDYHHGDGSEAMALADERLAYGSVHADPSRNFPGTGRVGRGLRITNIPVGSRCGGEAWIAAVEQMIDALALIPAGALVLSFGTDALAGDRHGDVGIGQDDLERAARLVLARWPALPVVSLLEGGYETEGLAEAVARHLGALAG